MKPAELLFDSSKLLLLLQATTCPAQQNDESVLSHRRPWPFDPRFHFLPNLAVGGNRGGKEGVDAKAFPAATQVDYVRVYRMIER